MIELIDDVAEGYARRSWPRAVTMRARPGHPFVTSRVRNVRLRTHLVNEVRTNWRRGQLDRTVANTRCGRTLASARLTIDAPFELCDNCILADFSGPCVYRLLGASGEVLYIGCTENIWTRMLFHKSTAYWPLIADWKFSAYPTVAEALEVEAAEIAKEQPPLNTDLTWRARNPKRRGLVETGTVA